MRIPIVLLSLGVVGCDATLSPTGAVAVQGPTATQVGGVFEGRVHLPRDYNVVLGVETMHRGQVVPKTAADQWRVGVVTGYNPLKQPDDPFCGFEAIAKAGYFRGASGKDGSGDINVVSGGPYVGGALGLPLRLSRAVEPWENDDIFSMQWSLVPWLGGNVLAPNGDIDDARVEIAGGLGFRLTISSSFFP